MGKFGSRVVPQPPRSSRDSKLKVITIYYLTRWNKGTSGEDMCTWCFISFSTAFHVIDNIFYLIFQF